jgi:hypothetical protein
MCVMARGRGRLRHTSLSSKNSSTLARISGALFESFYQHVSDGPSLRSLHIESKELQSEIVDETRP